VDDNILKLDRAVPSSGTQAVVAPGKLSCPAAEPPGGSKDLPPHASVQSPVSGGFKDGLGKPSGVVLFRNNYAGRALGGLRQPRRRIHRSSSRIIAVRTQIEAHPASLSTAENRTIWGERCLPREDAVDQLDFFLAGNGFAIGPALLGLLRTLLSPASGFSQSGQQDELGKPRSSALLLRLLAPRRTRFAFCRAHRARRMSAVRTALVSRST